MRITLLSLLTLSLAVSASAQQTALSPSQTLRVTTSPQFAGTYHPSRGLELRTAGASNFRLEAIYNNNSLSNYFSIPGQDVEWIDEGELLQRHSTAGEQMASFDFAYCSSDSNPNGVQSVFTFYDDVQACAGPNLSWPAGQCSYGVSGLPGGSNGNLACWIVQVDLLGVECNLQTGGGSTRLFGVGQVWDSQTTGPWIARGGLGNENSYVAYDTTAPNANTAYLGCFDFGGVPFAGLAMGMYGYPKDVKPFYSQFGKGAEDSIILAPTSEVKAGSTIDFNATNLLSFLDKSSTLWVSRQRVDIKVPNLHAYLLADYRSRIYNDSTTTGDYSLPVPPSTQGIYYLQAVQFVAGVPTYMSNGLKLYFP